jgi:hypothetical protein
MENKYLKALEKRYESQMLEAEANLELYLNYNNLSAIGEHSDLLAEQDKWLEVYSSASDKLENLKKLFSKEFLKKEKLQKING